MRGGEGLAISISDEAKAGGHQVQPTAPRALKGTGSSSIISPSPSLTHFMHTCLFLLYHSFSPLSHIPLPLSYLIPSFLPHISHSFHSVLLSLPPLPVITVGDFRIQLVAVAVNVGLPAHSCCLPHQAWLACLVFPGL